MRRVALAALFACSACMGTGGLSPEESAELEGAIDDLEGEFGGLGKADLFPSPCDLLEPFLAFGDDSIRSGFYLGVAGQGVLGPGVGLAGYDIVFDLYHQQMYVAKYKGAGLTTGLSAGASVQLYAGAGFGFDNGVYDWDRWFVNFSGNISLPFLKNYLSLTPTFFVSGEDDDGNGVVSPAEVLVPPDGLYGFGVGVTAGVSLPDPLPVDLSLTEGYWSPHKDMIRWFYDDYVEAGLDVRLRDVHSGGECGPDWPSEEGDRHCIVEFGDPASSHVRRSLTLARGICHSAGRCTVPLAWPMSGAALGIGLLKSSGHTPSELCD